MTIKKKPGNSILAQAMAQLSESADPLPLWWRDELKLVGAAVNAARSNIKTRQRLLKLIAEWAKEDEGFRRLLQTDLQDAGKGKKGNTSNIFWHDALLVDSINAARQQGCTLSQACEFVLASHSDLFNNADVDSLSSRYQKAKIRLKKAHVKPLIQI